MLHLAKFALPLLGLSIANEYILKSYGISKKLIKIINNLNVLNTKYDFEKDQQFYKKNHIAKNFLKKNVNDIVLETYKANELIKYMNMNQE